MLSAKDSYSRNIHIQEKQAIKNEKISKQLKNCKRRYKLHKEDMRPVDLDEIINKYAPGAKMYIYNYKIKYSNGISQYVIYADPSGYVRVYNTLTDSFVDVYADKTLTEDTTNYNKLTHFRIKRRGEK